MAQRAEINTFRAERDARARGMRTALLAAFISASAAGWTAGTARTARLHQDRVAPAKVGALQLTVLPLRRERSLELRATVQMCAAVGSIAEVDDRFKSGFGLRNKARLLRRSWVIWSCCVFQAVKCLSVRRKYANKPDSPEAVEARRDLAAGLRDTLIRLGPTFIKVRALTRAGFFSSADVMRRFTALGYHSRAFGSPLVGGPAALDARGRVATRGDQRARAAAERGNASTPTPPARPRAPSIPTRHSSVSRRCPNTMHYFLTLFFLNFRASG